MCGCGWGGYISAGDYWRSFPAFNVLHMGWTDSLYVMPTSLVQVGLSSELDNISYYVWFKEMKIMMEASYWCERLLKDQKCSLIYDTRTFLSFANIKDDYMTTV